MPLISLIACIGIEYYALIQFLLDDNGWAMYRYFLGHAAASVLITFVQVRYLPKVYHEWRREAWIFLFSINFSLLSFGFLVTSIFASVGFRSMSRQKNDILSDKISFHQLSDNFPKIKRIFGEGSLNNALDTPSTHSAIKLKALTTLNHAKNPEAMKQIKKSLGDSSDEVRLYSFSLIDNFEKELNGKIHNALTELENADDDLSKATVYKKLALLYWEMLYYEVADVHLKIYFTEKVHEMIDASLHCLWSDTALWVLRGRIFLLSGDIEEAESSFQRALELGAKPKNISTYMAEIAFLKKKFSEVSKWLRQYPESAIDLKMYSIYALWTVKYEHTDR